VVEPGAATADRHASGTTEPANGDIDIDQPIATVAGRPIRRADLERRADELRRGPRGRHISPDGGSSLELRRWIVRELVTEAILAHEAQAAGLLGPDDHPDRVSAATMGALVDRVTTGASVDEGEMRSFYDRNTDRYRRHEARRIHHAVLPDEASARDVANRLASAGEVTDIPSVELHRGELVGPLEDAVFAAARGDVVGPIATEHGWHVARLEDVVPAGIVPFEDARPGIQADLLAVERIQAFERWLETRRAELAVLDPDFEHPGHPVHGATTHRH
jgi:hypothetical protein